MGQIILYNVSFSTPPAGNVGVHVYYRKEGALDWIDFGIFSAGPDGQFLLAVVIPTEDNTWYYVKADLDCSPCFTEKRMFSQGVTPPPPCCTPEIIKAYVQVIGVSNIGWIGADRVCLQDANGHNNGKVRYINRKRTINGVVDGYIELNTPGPNFVPDEIDPANCPLPVFGWAGLNPICLLDTTGNNTGIKHWTDRARLINGAPDGYIERNDPGADYVMDILDVGACPVPVFTWRGINPYCVLDGFGKNTGFKAYARRERMANGIPDGYSETNSFGSNYVPPIYDPVACVLPGISWAGAGPVCVVSIDGFNTGGVRYTIRVRLVDGVADGYSEPNTPGPSYVPDYVDNVLCPVPVISWVGHDPICLHDEFDFHTGYFMYQFRRRVVNGVEDGFVEPNVQDADYVAGGYDPVFCPLPPAATTTIPVPATTTIPVPPLITWQGLDPVCEKIPTCPEGQTLSPDGLTCTLEETAAPSIAVSGYCLATARNAAYGVYFSRIYNPGFAQGSIMVLTAPPAEVFAEMMHLNQWRNTADAFALLGPCNRSAVWIDSNCDGSPDGLTPGARTTITAQFYNAGAVRRVYVGCFGDNEFELKVNENLIAKSTATNDMPFRVFHIFPVDLVSGMNYFNLVGVGDGSSTDALGMIVYDDTPEAIRDAVSDATLHILFSSASLNGTTYSVATCPTGYVLDGSNPAAYVCRKFTRVGSTLVNTGIAVYSNRGRLVNGVADGYTEPNTPGANYVPGYSDAATCPL